MSFCGWVIEQELWCLCPRDHCSAINRNTVQKCGWICREFCWLKKSSPNRLYAVWSHWCNIHEMQHCINRNGELASGCWGAGGCRGGRGTGQHGHPCADGHFCILTFSMLVSFLWCCLIVLQDGALGKPAGGYTQSQCRLSFKWFYVFIFLAALGLRCSEGFSLVVESGSCSPVVVCGLLIAVASLVSEHRL